MAQSEQSLPAGQPQPKRRTQSLQLQEVIEAAILQGEFGPGDRLDESGLAQRYGVSRTPVREALKGLAAAGLVVVRPHAGVIVANPSVGEIMEMFELMAMLEAFAASRAARRATTIDLAALKETHQKCKEAAKTDKPALFFDANQDFHESIYVAAHNSVLREQIMALDKRLAPYRRLVTFRPGRIEESNDEHAAILDAIERVAPDDASQAMREHLDLLAEDALALARATEEGTGALSYKRG
jgi:DNA-binding GntR family transcriptional regulator